MFRGNTVKNICLLVGKWFCSIADLKQVLPCRCDCRPGNVQTGLFDGLAEVVFHGDCCCSCCPVVSDVHPEKNVLVALHNCHFSKLSLELIDDHRDYGGVLVGYFCIIYVPTNRTLLPVDVAVRYTLIIWIEGNSEQTNSIKQGQSSGMID
jgi:hypothetical protein